MSATEAGKLSRLAEFAEDQWSDVVDNLIRSRLESIFSQLPPDDEFASLPPDQLRTARESLGTRLELTRPSRYERTSTLLAGTIFGLLSLIVILWAVKLAVSALRRTHQIWVTTAQGGSDIHLTRFVARTLADLNWPGPWLSAIAFGAFIGIAWATWRVFLHRLEVFDECLDALARPQLREIINTNTNLVGIPTMIVRRARALTQISSINHFVHRPEAQRIRRLITELGANSIAISGSRGSGKTTLLRNIADRSALSVDAGRWLQIHMTAPVGYDSRDFLIHLYLRLCQTVSAYLHFGGTGRFDRLYGIRRGLQFIVRSVLTIVVLAIVQEALIYPTLNPQAQADQIVSTLHRHTVQALERIGMALPGGWTLAGLLAGLVALYLVAPWIGRRPARHGMWRHFWSANPKELERTTNRNLLRLRFNQTLSSNWSGNLKAWQLTLGWGRTRQLAEAPLSLPELVDSYREYVGSVNEWWRPDRSGISIAITIDEMDRISDPVQAERFLNDIKAIFNIPGCVYLVSVSEDALAGFESRVVHMRTAMDSSFDEVVRLPPFTLEQSLEVIRRRVVGFPDVFIALCHCVSGGVPRDLVRAARTLIELREDGQPNDLPTLSKALVDAEIDSLRRGLSAKLAHDELLTHDPALFPHLVGGQGQQSSRETFAELATISSLESEGNPLAAPLAAGLRYFATVLEIFEGDFTFASVAVTEPSSPERALLDDLAQTRATLQVSPSLAATQLDQLRRRIRIRRRSPRRPKSS